LGSLIQTSRGTTPFKYRCAARRTHIARLDPFIALPA
jgi:hypothetical protein